MSRTASLLPLPLRDYLTKERFWAESGEFDLWYALCAEEWFWVHLRRRGRVTLAVTLFHYEGNIVEVDLYNLSRAPISGIRATIANTPLMSLQRWEPPRPTLALRLRDGRSTAFTLPTVPHTLPDQWLAEALERLHGALTEQWHVQHGTWGANRAQMRALWPEWAGPAPPT